MAAEEGAGDCRVTTCNAGVVEGTLQEVWELVRSFEGIKAWLPVITACKLVEGVDNQIGAVRQVAVGDIAVRERLLAYSELDHAMTYGMLDDTAQVMVRAQHPHAHRAHLQLRALTKEKRTFVEYNARITVEQAGAPAAQEWLDTTYGGFLDQLAATLAARRSSA